MNDDDDEMITIMTTIMATIMTTTIITMTVTVNSKKKFETTQSVRCMKYKDDKKVI